MDKRLKLIFVALMVLLAGCAGAGAGDGGSAQSGGAESADFDDGTSVSVETGSGGDAEEERVDSLQVQQRAVIKNGFIDLTVENFSQSQTDVESTASSYGGYISDSNENVNRRSGGTYRSGTLTVRVPSEDFEAFMSDMKEVGEVEHVETNSQDVTDQLVDIEARLSNLRVQRDRLRELYENANTTEDVLAVEARLTEVQTEIERLEAQQASLESRVALSTVRVHLSEQPPGPAQWYDVPVLQAFLESIDGVFVTLRALVVALAYALPYLVVFGGLFALFGSGVVFVGRRALRRLRT
ncbi:DUF4349 domain-containing protein [Haloferax sp. DFSO60]|uniref:DUF4349 domain-containing protein n=1 Tax=Haloferax sp. DFSO60 TaxID=3388652 RepID=UPI00397A26E0